MKRISAVILIGVLLLSASSCKNMQTAGQTGQNADAATPSVLASTTDATSNPENAIQLQGTIGTLPVHMTLIIKAGKVTGSYYYDTIKQAIKLDGMIEVNRMINFSEYGADGKEAGKFDGWYTPGISLTGLWTNAKTNEILKFNLNVIDGIPKDAVWSGEWNRKNGGVFNTSTLVIFNETKTSFDFQISAFFGGHMGFFDGTATISGNTAICMEAETRAEITMKLHNGDIELGANEAANGYGGAGVYFEGTYTKDKLPEMTLLSTGYVESKTQEDEFKALVGADAELFLNTAQIKDDLEDLDGYHATCYHWWVVGLVGTNESVVMFLPDGTICGAVLDPGTEIVKVYTNSPAIKSVPKTIQAWIDTLHVKDVKFITNQKD
ncbi:hypothetical protein IZU99_03040 [Oscillospiraceae bacterium CM]|nr:hypothetical protein IZU99_03040 [Oscillospiraceae bacterium CM]